MNALGNLFDVIPGILPLDLQTARVSDVISLKNAAGVSVVLFKGAGTDGDDQSLTFEQGTSIAFNTAKALTVSGYWKKEGTLTSVGTWTRVDVDPADDAFTLPDPSAQSEAVYVFEISAGDLDRDGGYSCIRVSTGGEGANAQLGALLFLLHGLSYPSAPEKLPSAIA